MGSKCCKCSSDKGIAACSAGSSNDSYPAPRPRPRLNRRQQPQQRSRVWEELVSGEMEGETEWARPDGPPFLSRRLTDQAVKVGTRTRLLVEIASSSPLTVVWLHEGQKVEESERIKFINEGNFYCADISPVTMEDEGSWTCQGQNAGGLITSQAKLTLIVPRQYKEPEFVEPVRAVLGVAGTVSLETKVVGVPTPSLKWYKDDVEIKPGDVLGLTPDPADPSLGTYTCVATNCMGSAVSTSNLHVVSPDLNQEPTHDQGLSTSGPKPIFSKDLRNEKIKVGGTLNLECQVRVPPWPDRVSWYNSEGEVREGPRAHLMEDGMGGYAIRVSPIHAADDGSWRFVATNRGGATSVTTSNVAVSYPKNYRKPKFLDSLKAILTDEGLVSFECKVVGYPTPQLSWFKDGQELKPGDVYQLTGTNSLGSYCCIARNCMGEAESTAVLTVEDIQSQLTEEERLQLFSDRLPPKFIQGLKSAEAKISEPISFAVKVSVSPEPTILWFRDDEHVEESETRYKFERDKLGLCSLHISRLEFVDQAEWKCVAMNDYGQSVTSSYLKLNIPRHYKKPKFLEELRAVLSDEGAVNLECKVIGVPQPVLKWFKDGKELKPGDIHRIISGQDGSCCLGTYTCVAQNCMGTVSSSASLLGFQDKSVTGSGKVVEKSNTCLRDTSLSTIQEERTSQLHDTDKSLTLDDRPEEVSFSFDGREVSVSLYETPDLTEEEALQIVEMYADQISEHVSEHNIVELPPMRFTKESSTSGKLLMEAMVIDVSPDYFTPAEVDDNRTDADIDEFSMVEETMVTPDEERAEIEFPTSPERKESGAGKTIPSTSKEDKHKRRKKRSIDSEKEDDSLQEFERRKSERRSTKERRRTESEMEDDSLYEFESRKAHYFEKPRDLTLEREGISETAADAVKSGDTVSVFKTAELISPINSPDSKPSATEADFTYETAEDSAFDKSEISVLESLAHSLHEIQRGLATVEAQAISETHEILSPQVSVLESLAQPLADVQRSLEVMEEKLDEGLIGYDVLETLVQPINEFRKNLRMIDDEKVLQRRASSIMESLSKPLQELEKEIAFIQEQCYPRRYSSEERYAKTVEEVQETLAKIIERQESVPHDRKLMKTISVELQELEETANDDLEKYYDRLLTCGTDIRKKLLDEDNQEIVDVLRSISDLVKPLKHLTGVTSKCITVIVKDYETQGVPSAKLVESLVKPLEALKSSLDLLESVSGLKSHRAIRGVGIPLLYKLSVPMDELETTIKLVENLSAHTAVEFLVPPLENLIQVVSHLDLSSGGEGFLENMPVEGTRLLTKLEESMECMVNSINTIQTNVQHIESDKLLIEKLPNVIKPLEELEKSLKPIKDRIGEDLSYDEVCELTQNLNKPLQSLRSELSILQHEIEIEQYGDISGAKVSSLSKLVEPLQIVQKTISTFHESVLCKEDPIHLRFVLFALKEIGEPLKTLSAKISQTEDAILKGDVFQDPDQGLRNVIKIVKELRETSSLTKSDLPDIYEASSYLAEPLEMMETGLLDILTSIQQKERIHALSLISEPLQELQSAILNIDALELLNDSEALELKQSFQDLEQSIFTIQDQICIESGDDSGIGESKVSILDSLVEPLQSMRTQLSEIQRASVKSLIKTDRVLTDIRDASKNIISIINVNKDGDGPLSGILQSLECVIENLGSAVETQNIQIGQGQQLDEARQNMSAVLISVASSLGDTCAEADELSVKLEGEKRTALILIQDMVHDLKSAVESTAEVIEDKKTGIEQNFATANALEQLKNAMTEFSHSISGVSEVPIETPKKSVSMDELKDYVVQLERDVNLVIDKISSTVDKKVAQPILDTILNDVKSVKRVVLNMAEERNLDESRIQFVLEKVKYIETDLQELSKDTLKEEYTQLNEACKTAQAIVSMQDQLIQTSREECEKTHSDIIETLIENVKSLESVVEKVTNKPSGVADKNDIAKISQNLLILQENIISLTNEEEVVQDFSVKVKDLVAPVKIIEEALHNVQVDSVDLKEAVVAISKITNACEKAKKDVSVKSEFEKLFSAESLSDSIDAPLIISITDKIENLNSEIKVLHAKNQSKLLWFIDSLEESVIKLGKDLGENINNINETEVRQILLDTLEKVKGEISEIKLTDSDKIKELSDAIDNFECSLDKGPHKILPALQELLRPILNLHENVVMVDERTIKRAETKYLENCSKASNDLELGLMKLEKALITSAEMDLQVISKPLQVLLNHVESISHDPTFEYLEEDSNIAQLQAMAVYMGDINNSLVQLEEVVSLPDKKEKIEHILISISKPVRELRHNIALIQEQALMMNVESRVTELEDLKDAISVVCKHVEEEESLRSLVGPVQVLKETLEAACNEDLTAEEIEGPVKELKLALETVETEAHSLAEDSAATTVAVPLIDLCHHVVQIIETRVMEGLGPDETSISDLATLASVEDVTDNLYYAAPSTVETKFCQSNETGKQMKLTEMKERIQEESVEENKNDRIETEVSTSKVVDKKELRFENEEAIKTDNLPLDQIKEKPSDKNEMLGSRELKSEKVEIPKSITESVEKMSGNANLEMNVKDEEVLKDKLVDDSPQKTKDENLNKNEKDKVSLTTEDRLELKISEYSDKEETNSENINKLYSLKIYTKQLESEITNAIKSTSKFSVKSILESVIIDIKSVSRVIEKLLQDKNLDQTRLKYINDKIGFAEGDINLVYKDIFKGDNESLQAANATIKTIISLKFILSDLQEEENLDMTAINNELKQENRLDQLMKHENTETENDTVENDIEEQKQKSEIKTVKSIKDNKDKLNESQKRKEDEKQQLEESETYKSENPLTEIKEKEVLTAEEVNIKEEKEEKVKAGSKNKDGEKHKAGSKQEEEENQLKAKNKDEDVKLSSVKRKEKDKAEVIIKEKEENHETEEKKKDEERKLKGEDKTKEEVEKHKAKAKNKEEENLKEQREKEEEEEKHKSQETNKDEAIILKAEAMKKEKEEKHKAEDKKKEADEILKAEAKKGDEKLKVEAKKKKEEVKLKDESEKQEEEEKVNVEAKKEEEEKHIAEVKKKEEHKEMKAKAKKKEEEEEEDKDKAEANKKEENKFKAEAKKKEEEEIMIADAKKKENEEKQRAETKKKEEEKVKAEAKKKEEKEEEEDKDKAEANNKKEETLKVEAKKKKEENEKLKTQAKKKEEEKVKAEGKKREDEKLKAEAKKKEEEEKAKADAKKKEEEENFKAETKKKKEEENLKADAKKKEEEEDKLKAEAKKKEEEEKLKTEAKKKEEEKVKAEAKKREDEKLKAEAKKKEEEEKANADAKKTEAEENLKAETKKKKEEEKLKADAKKKEEEEKEKVIAEAKKKEEEKVIAEAKKKEVEDKLKADAEKKEEEEKLKTEAKKKEEEKVKAEAKKREDEKLKAEAKKKEEEEEKANADAKMKEAEEDLKAETKKKKEEEKLKADAKKKEEEEEEKVKVEAKKKEKEKVKAEAKKKEEEEKAKAEAKKKEVEKLKTEAKKKEEEEKLKTEAKKKEEAEKLKAEAKKQEEEEKLNAEAKKKEEEEAQAIADGKKKEEEKLKAAAKKKEEEEKLNAEAKKKEKEEKLKAEAKKKEEEEKLKAEAKKKEEAEKLKAEAKKMEEEEKVKTEAKKKDEEEKLKAEAKKKEEEQLKAETKKKEEEKLKAESKKKEEEEKLKAEAKKKEEEDKLKAEAKNKKNEEEKLKVEAKKKEEEQLKAETKKKVEEKLKAEAKKKEEEEKLKAEAKKKEEEEKLKAEAKKKKEEEDKLKAEAKKKDEEEKLKVEAKKKEEEEKAKAEAKKKEEEEKLKAEAKMKEEEEKLKAEAKKKEEEKLKAEAKKKEEEEKLKVEAKKIEEEEKAKAEAKKKEEEEKLKAEAKKKEEEEKLKAEAKKKEEEEKLKAEAKKKEEEEKLKAEAKKKEEDEKLKAEAKKKEEEEKLKVEAKKKEEEEKAKAEAKKKEEEKLKAEAKKNEEEKLKAEAKKKEEEKAKAEAKKKEEEEKLKAEAKKKEEEEDEKLKAEAKKKKEEEDKLKAEAKKKDEEEKLKVEAKKKEEEEKAKAEAKKKEEEEKLKAEAKMKEEEEKLKAEAKKKEEEKLKAEAKKKEEEEKLKVEAKKKEEEEKAKAEAKKKEEEKLKAEAKKKEEEKLKAEAKKKEEEEKLKVEAKKKEEEEKAKAEAKKKEEEKLKAEAKKKEEEKLKAEAKKEEEQEKLKAEARKKEEEEKLKVEAKKKEEEEKAKAESKKKKEEEEKLKAEAKKKDEEVKLNVEAKKKEEEEKAKAESMKKKEEEKLKAEAKMKEEEEKLKAEAKKEEEKVKAEAKKKEEKVNADAKKEVEEKLKAEAKKKEDEEQLKAEAKKKEAEEKLEAEAKKKEEEKLKAEAKKKEEEEKLKVEAKKKEDDEKAKAESKKKKEDKLKAEAKKKEEEEKLKVEAKKKEEEEKAKVEAKKKEEEEKLKAEVKKEEEEKLKAEAKMKEEEEELKAEVQKKEEKKVKAEAKKKADEEKVKADAEKKEEENEKQNTDAKKKEKEEKLNSQSKKKEGEKVKTEAKKKEEEIKLKVETKTGQESISQNEQIKVQTNVNENEIAWGTMNKNLKEDKEDIPMKNLTNGLSRESKIHFDILDVEQKNDSQDIGKNALHSLSYDETQRDFNLDRKQENINDKGIEHSTSCIQGREGGRFLDDCGLNIKQEYAATVASYAKNTLTTRKYLIDDSNYSHLNTLSLSSDSLNSSKSARLQLSSTNKLVSKSGLDFSREYSPRDYLVREDYSKKDFSSMRSTKSMDFTIRHYAVDSGSGALDSIRRKVDRSLRSFNKHLSSEQIMYGRSSEDLSIEYGGSSDHLSRREKPREHFVIVSEDFSPLAQSRRYTRRRSASPLPTPFISSHTSGEMSLRSQRSRSRTRYDLIERQPYICSALRDKRVEHGANVKLTCNIGGDPEPTVQWRKDGQIIESIINRFIMEYSFGVASLEIRKVIGSDAGQYTCVAINSAGQTATTATLRVNTEHWQGIDKYGLSKDLSLPLRIPDRSPRITGLIADSLVPTGGVIALHLQVEGCPRTEITWLKEGSPLRFGARMHKLFDQTIGLHTLLLEGATLDQAGMYHCKVLSGVYHLHEPAPAHIQVVERRPNDKPALITARPETRINLTSGEDITLTCYISGEPKPRVMFMKGLKDITEGGRTLKESFGEYTRLTLKRALPEDSGTYFIVARNPYGTDRAFSTVKIRERTRSLTPTRREGSVMRESSVFSTSSHLSSLSYQ